MVTGDIPASHSFHYLGIAWLWDIYNLWGRGAVQGRKPDFKLCFVPW